MHLTENAKVCYGLGPQADLRTLNGEGVRLRDAHMLYAVCLFDQNAVATIEVVPQRNDAEDTGWIALANPVRIWVNDNVAADDVLVRQDDDVDYETTAADRAKLVILQIDPSALGIHTGGNNLPCDRVRIRLLGNQLDVGSVMYYIVPARYQGAEIPEVRV